MSCGAASAGVASGTITEILSPGFTVPRGLVGAPFRRMYCSRMSSWMRERERSSSFDARKASRRGWLSSAEISMLKSGGGCGLDEDFRDGADVCGWQGFRDKGAENDATVWCFAGNDFQDGGGADFHMDVAGAGGGDGEVARHEVEAAVTAFIEDDFPFAIENEDVGCLEVFCEPVAEDLYALEEACFGWGRWLWGFGFLWCEGFDCSGRCGCRGWFRCGLGLLFAFIALRKWGCVFFLRIGEANEGGVKAGIGGLQVLGGDGAEQLLGKVSNLGGVEPWIDWVHQ